MLYFPDLTCPYRTYFMDDQNQQNSQQPLTNAEIKAKLDEVDKELNQFDELANIVEEQQGLLDMEKQLKDMPL